MTEEVIKNITVKIHTITYRTCVLKESGLNLPEKVFYEDFEYSLVPLRNVHTISYLNTPVYYYLTEQKSQSVSDESIYKNIQMFIVVYRHIMSYLDKKANYDERKEVSEYIDEQILIFLRQIYNIFLRNADKEDCIDRLKRSDREIKEISARNYSRVSQRNPYIYVERLYNKHVIKALSKLYSTYKGASRGEYKDA